MAECMTPFYVKLENGNEQPVPCGKCPTCYARRASQWSFRLMQEYKISKSAHFITLTYDTNHVPITERGYMALDKRDCQLFIKRLRRSHPNGCIPIKYYLVGEYGATTFRPHYHAIIFNADIKLIQPAWEKGQVHYGTVTEASVGYCLKYMSKTSQIPKHQNDDRIKEFGLMSKGLGHPILPPLCSDGTKLIPVTGCTVTSWMEKRFQCLDIISKSSIPRRKELRPASKHLKG